MNCNCLCDITANKTTPFSIVLRVTSIVLTLCSTVLWILIAIYALSPQSVNLLAFQSNTFLQTMHKGPHEYTWMSFEVGDYKAEFKDCIQKAHIFDHVCDHSNGTDQDFCMREKFPVFSHCTHNIFTLTTPPFPFNSFSDALLSCLQSSSDVAGLSDLYVPSRDITTFQEDFLRQCISLDQQPRLTVMQDKHSTQYLGSFNAAIFLLTGAYIYMIFFIYTMFIPFFGKDIQDKYKGSKLRISDDNEGVTRTGFRVTIVCFLLAAVLVIILAIFTWRDASQNIDVPMNTHTATICFAFALAVLYYFGVEIWEKIFIEDSENVAMGPRLDLAMKGDAKDNATALLIFPWAESAIFTDTLIFVGLFGLQADVTTVEISTIFQATMYAAVLSVAYTYDYYEGYKKDSTLVKPWIMAFCNNMAIWVLNFIPFIIVIRRFGGVAYPYSVNPYLVSYACIHYIMYFVKIAWQFLHTSPVFLGWSELFWYIKSGIQLFFMFTIFFAANSAFGLNNTLRDHANLWLVNY